MPLHTTAAGVGEASTDFLRFVNGRKPSVGERHGLIAP